MNDLTPFTPDKRYYAKRLDELRAKGTVESIIATGSLLIEADRNGVLVRTRNAGMLMGIAKHPVLTDPNYASRLPASWTILNRLASVDVAPLVAAIEDGRIHPKIPQRKAFAWVAATNEGRPKMPRTNVVQMSDSRHDRAYYAEKIRAALGKTVEGFVEAGNWLKQAKRDLKHGEFEAMIKSDLPCSPRTARRMMAIANDPIISNRTNWSDLPPSWTTLYDLTSVPRQTAEAALKDGRINSKMGAKAVAALLPPKPPKPPKVKPEPAPEVEQAKQPEPVAEQPAAVIAPEIEAVAVPDKKRGISDAEAIRRAYYDMIVGLEKADAVAEIKHLLRVVMFERIGGKDWSTTEHVRSTELSDKHFEITISRDKPKPKRRR